MEEINQPIVSQSPAPTENLVPAPVSVVPGQIVPPPQKSNKSWLIVAIIGCCASFLIIPILIIIFIVIGAINPVARIKQSQQNFSQNNVRIASNAINVCITTETNKGTKSTIIYSVQGCANKTFLKTNSYLNASDEVTLSSVNIISNTSGTKICAYIGTDSTNLTSWDTTTGVVSALGAGKNSCL